MFTFSVNAPGSVELHAFSVSTSNPYDLSSLRACVQADGQAGCSPGPFPDPAYWQISAADLTHGQSYQVRVLAQRSSSALVGLSVGWNGPHRLDVSGLSLPGGCSGSTGYTAGCGMKFRFSTASPGTATVSATPGGLHLSVKDKSTNTKVFSGVVNGSASFPVSGGTDYEGHVYPESGNPVQSVHLNWTWP